MPKYPDINVQLTNRDGNAFNILGIVGREMRKGGVPKEEIDDFMVEAMAGDYDNLLRTCMEWVDVS